MKKAIPVLLLPLLFYACGSPGNYHPAKLDTIPKGIFTLRLATGGLAGPFYDTVIKQVLTQYVFADTPNNKGGHWRTDTTAYGRVLTADTLRDGQKHPLYDSLHHVKFIATWYSLPKGYYQQPTFPTK